jgi:hypothetical protein
MHSYLKTSTPFIMMNLSDHIESIWIIFRFKIENKIQFACIILLMISSSDILISFSRNDTYLNKNLRRKKWINSSQVKSARPFNYEKQNCWAKNTKKVPSSNFHKAHGLKFFLSLKKRCFHSVNEAFSFSSNKINLTLKSLFGSRLKTDTKYCCFRCCMRFHAVSRVLKVS